MAERWSISTAGADAPGTARRWSIDAAAVFTKGEGDEQGGGPSWNGPSGCTTKGEGAAPAQRTTGGGDERGGGPLAVRRQGLFFHSYLFSFISIFIITWGTEEEENKIRGVFFIK
jgi:hypothetical protein